MALKKDFTDYQTGVTLANAYHRINAPVADYIAKQVQFVVLVYRDEKAAKVEDKQPFAVRSFAIRNIPASESPDGLPKNESDSFFGDAVFQKGGTDPRKQCYLWLKQQAMYAGAADV